MERAAPARSGRPRPVLGRAARSAPHLRRTAVDRLPGRDTRPIGAAGTTWRAGFSDRRLRRGSRSGRVARYQGRQRVGAAIDAPCRTGRSGRASRTGGTQLRPVARTFGRRSSWRRSTTRSGGASRAEPGSTRTSSGCAPFAGRRCRPERRRRRRPPRARRRSQRARAEPGRAPRPQWCRGGRLATRWRGEPERPRRRRRTGSSRRCTSGRPGSPRRTPPRRPGPARRSGSPARRCWPRSAAARPR